MLAAPLPETGFAGPEDSASRADLQDLTLASSIIVLAKARKEPKWKTSGAARNAKMDRREFLRLAALSSAMLMGISSALEGAETSRMAARMLRCMLCPLEP